MKNMSILINVCGSNRSGTTMLDLMLGNASDAFSCGEVYAWFRPWRTHHFKIVCSCGQNPCPVWEKIKAVPENKFHSTVFKHLKVNFVIDSSKEECWLLDTQQWASKHKIQVFNLLLWKNPIDLAYSYWKRGKDIRQWRNDFVRYYKNIFSTNLPFYSVYLNDLLSDPKTKLLKICSVVGMPYFEGKENFSQKQHHHLFGSLGTRRQALSNNLVIRTHEIYPTKFEKKIELLSKQILLDVQLQEILEVLIASEISKSATSNIRSHTFEKPYLYPLWYYTKYGKRLFRYYFPQSWSHVQ